MIVRIADKIQRLIDIKRLQKIKFGKGGGGMSG